MPEPTAEHPEHIQAFQRWKAAEAEYWELIGALDRGEKPADEHATEVIDRLEATHKAWMEASRPLLRLR